MGTARLPSTTRRSPEPSIRSGWATTARPDRPHRSRGPPDLRRSPDLIVELPGADVLPTGCAAHGVERPIAEHLSVAGRKLADGPGDGQFGSVRVFEFACMFIPTAVYLHRFMSPAVSGAAVSPPLAHAGSRGARHR